MSTAAIDTRAEAYGWPVTMCDVLERASQKASLEYTQLQRKLKTDTTSLQDNIEECSKQVSAFASLNDVNEQVWKAKPATYCEVKPCRHYITSVFDVHGISLESPVGVLFSHLLQWIGIMSQLD